MTAEIVTTTTVDPSDPVLAGHFPGFAILPGVLLIEYAHQAALSHLAGKAAGAELTRIESARFLAPVFPGDRVVTELSVKAVEDGWRCTARLLAGSEPAALVKLRYRRGSAQ
ncbi:MAG TPA: FabA/FabZ family ACP-dehydratase [Candidatus Limnocylindrales bacterium]|nr:FabA/FabZ family ACP-dehydratase [Candidatus Limnocylindrales bacterium]